MTLKELGAGDCAVITSVGGEGALRQHFLDMGVIPGTAIKMLKAAPMGDPVEYEIHGYSLTLRLDDAAKIGITEDAPETEADDGSLPDEAKTKHPRLGEQSAHLKSDGEPVNTGKLTFALVGNQNSGKTTLFNTLTGSDQHVGNFPGVTVDRKDGVIRGYPDTMVTDLPGIYSMSPYSPEEIVSRRFVLDDKPMAIINIVDATNIERNLYLTMQLIEMDVPMVVALNMMDELTGNGGSVDINKMEEMLGVPVVPISAALNKGVDELVEHAVHIARYDERPVRQDLCDKKRHGGAVHRCLHGMIHLIEDNAKDAGLPVRFAASKLCEGDELILDKLALDDGQKAVIEQMIAQMEKERGLDRSAAIADMRFDFIGKVCRRTVKKPRESKESIRSRGIDSILTGKYTAIPIFVLIIAAVCFLTFNVIGAFLQELIESGVSWLTELVDGLLTLAGINEVIHSLIIDGIFEGVGSVLSFLPIIVTLFFFLSMLEDSGYIARVAFVMDKPLRKIGLSGRSIVPMLIGFGCTVPAVMATRTLPSERDRKLTILLTPFMSCTAKVPVYVFFVGAFFPKWGWLITVGLYILGIVFGIITSVVYKKTYFKGEAVPFVMELPNYRMPSLKNVMLLLKEKALDFLHRAFTVILVATVVIWFLKSFDLRFNMVPDSSDNSLLADIAGIFEPILAPIGLGDWRICVSLISGFLAKESVVSTLGVLFSEGITSALTLSSAASMLVFSLLYTPCVAAVAAVKRELGTKWAVIVVVFQCAVAWVAALLVRLVLMCFGVY
ncbi:MAG: ferrous iron transport protein B [Oscillospiraceae bacterium]|nr:ferrous iron transport protein B [Oscillospiraceae bacterium]